MRHFGFAIFSNLDGIYSAIAEAQKSPKPTIIKLETIIGFGSKVQGTHGVHGARTYAQRLPLNSCP